MMLIALITAFLLLSVIVLAPPSHPEIGDLSRRVFPHDLGHPFLTLTLDLDLIAGQGHISAGAGQGRIVAGQGRTASRHPVGLDLAVCQDHLVAEGLAACQSRAVGLGLMEKRGQGQRMLPQLECHLVKSTAAVLRINQSLLNISGNFI